MKILCVECTEDELRANRGIMDAIVDACQGFVNSFYGSYTPTLNEGQEENEESEEEEEDG